MYIGVWLGAYWGVVSCILCCFGVGLGACCVVLGVVRCILFYWGVVRCILCCIGVWLGVYCAVLGCG